MKTNSPRRALPSVSWLLWLVGACSAEAPGEVGPVADAGAEDRRGDGGSLGAGVDGGGERPDGGVGADGDAGDGVEEGEPCREARSTCTAWNVRASCVESPEGPTWREEPCAGGCFAGECSATDCADECALGAESEHGTCRLWSLAEGEWTEAEPEGSLHDRARDYDQYLRRNHMPEGAVAPVFYTDESHAEVESFGSVVDSALWTGTALAAEAWRLEATGSPDAAARVASGARTLHDWFQVTGIPGYLARVAAPADSAEPFTWRCESHKFHCGVDYAGETWNWRGDTSRDQYTGVMLGHLEAYRATRDEDVRALLREDVVGLLEALMVVHENVPVHISIDGFEMDTTLDLENVILVPEETETGDIVITVDTGDLEHAQMDGVREFLPDWGPTLRQLPLMGWLPDIPRTGTAIMMGAFFQMALAMTDGVAGLEETHDRLEAYYEARADEWIDLARGWSYDNDCGDAYYAIHIAFIMAYAWAELEADPARAADLTGDLLDDRMWATVRGHKNSYFAFLWAATQGAPDADAVDGAVDQLAQFQPGPRVHVGRDNRDRYPADGDCNDQVDHGTAVDVGDRVVSEFLWQRNPWVMFEAGAPRTVEPGVDYLAAYWLARRHGLLPDDRSGTCARWDGR